MGPFWRLFAWDRPTRAPPASGTLKTRLWEGSSATLWGMQKPPAAQVRGRRSVVWARCPRVYFRVEGSIGVRSEAIFAFFAWTSSGATIMPALARIPPLPHDFTHEAT